MRLAPIPLEQVKQLPQVYHLTIPDRYRDKMGHMNMRYYLEVYDDAGDALFESFGLTPAFYREHGSGGFDLEHHIHYLNEVHIGDTVAVYARLVSRSAKRLHYLLFMVNESRGLLASVFECVNSYADLTIRKTAAYPPEIAAALDGILSAHQQLEWPAPVCGVMSS
ncbi:MAG: thioesterase family protein [Chloroflexi bacterium]|nr:thioesterase family protein [Chloroflexota bacterium]